MLINQQQSRTIWLNPYNQQEVQIIDQRFLPHIVSIKTLTCWQECAVAIKDMWVRGAPLIGVTAAYGLYLAALQMPEAEDLGRAFLREAAEGLLKTRPTAVNLCWAVEKQLSAMGAIYGKADKVAIALKTAVSIAEEDVETCRLIGEHGLSLLKAIAQSKQANSPVNIMTHCNAGWLATVDWGTATSPIYQAAMSGVPVHVWVSETRPRNQGANLTAWELSENKIPHTVVVDNCCGHLLQKGLVDICIVGTDRTARNGDVANKTGTYLKALAAYDNQVPFYVALPSSTIDWNMADGIAEMPIEQRSQDEVRYVSGWCEGKIKEVLITPQNSKAENYAFDVTPARLITGLITERGICLPSEQGLLGLFSEKKVG
ncbi:MAG: S-methyl-5-thioribose-1-phosphate isomerase [Sphingobacteriales bacterium]|nr:MAG: S-methyl-5-thioribose-1-phosphate isomerase [Sphingobacteriales bacterium]